MSWQFWQRQLAGKSPETTPGTPHQGFYLVRERRSWVNPAPTVGGSRRNVAVNFYPCAIWQDQEGWHCVIHKVGRWITEGNPAIKVSIPDETVYLTDVEKIDEVFSRCCRDAIPHSDYLELTKFSERADEPCDN